VTNPSWLLALLSEPDIWRRIQRRWRRDVQCSVADQDEDASTIRAMLNLPA
jgi:hypothetical protein